MTNASATAPGFIVYALPRSRSFWLSRFLTYGGWTCGHDEVRHARTLDDVRSWFAQPATGTVETSAAPWWRLVQRVASDIHTVVLRRPVDEVVQSLLGTGIQFDQVKLRERIKRLDAKLEQIAHRVPNALSVSFSDLADDATCARVCEHCLPYKHDPAWWSVTAAMNLQINLPAQFRYYEAHLPQIERLAKIAKNTILTEMARHPVEVGGVVFQEEPITSLFDGRALGEQHCVAVGETPDSWMAKNWPLMFKLQEHGAIHLMTARSNGRMFGYLMSVVGPSLESVDRTVATQTTFYCSPDYPGLGMKLQRASVDALRARGVGEVVFRAGARGSGPKMGALYRRLGAETAGETFNLKLAGQ